MFFFDLYAAYLLRNLQVRNRYLRHFPLKIVTFAHDSFDVFSYSLFLSDEVKKNI